MKLSDISYKVLYHSKGYIRLEVPAISSFSWTYLLKNFERSDAFSIPTGIKKFHFNPLSGRMVITYKPDDINILEYIKRMSWSPDLEEIIKG